MKEYYIEVTEKLAATMFKNCKDDNGIYIKKGDKLIINFPKTPEEKVTTIIKQ